MPQLTLFRKGFGGLRGAASIGTTAGSSHIDGFTQPGSSASHGAASHVTTGRSTAKDRFDVTVFAEKAVTGLHLTDLFRVASNPSLEQARPHSPAGRPAPGPAHMGRPPHRSL